MNGTWPPPPFLEDLGEPTQHLGDVDHDAASARLDLDSPPRVVDETPRLVVELVGDAGADERLGADRRTADGGTIDREVDAGVLEDLADPGVLDLVEGGHAALDRHGVLLEDVQASDPIGRDVADRRDRVMVDDGGD